MRSSSMEKNPEIFDCAVIGGGLAGLCLAIQLSQENISVVLFEKNEYPFHKVCGEYISMESWNFLERLGIPLSTLHLPLINELGISSEKGFMLNHSLQMGGFGISRYSLDHHLSKLAIASKVKVIQNCKVLSVESREPEYSEIHTSSGIFNSKIVCGSYGKYTPAFMQKGSSVAETKNNYIGVKYHIKSDLKPSRIELHNFQDGYCGISKVDQEWYCLCYLTTSENLKNNGKDIKEMEGRILHQNPFLKRYFTESEFVNPHPLAISNIHFNKKQTSVERVFLLGDAAGSITPLCGNGMSMGMRASALLASELVDFFRNKKKFDDVVIDYNNIWNKNFKQRIIAGSYLQNLFGKKNTTHVALKALNKVPVLMKHLISLTHGEKF